ncbi:MAG: hypothetical protein GXY44_02735 [Phycisphaerales bacterium]|nr:hypothetical protein [Phycisphaerales bacterium]
MAVARPQQKTPESTGLKAALITFVVLTLASIGFTIYLYTQQEELKDTAKRAQETAQRANQQQREAQQEIAGMVGQILGAGGNQNPDSAKLEQEIRQARASIFADPIVQSSGLTPETTLGLVPLLNSLYQLFSTQTSELADLKVQFQQQSGQMTVLNESATRKQKEFDSRIEQLSEQYEQMQATSTANRAAWETEVDKLKEQLSAATTRINRLTAEKQQALAEGQARLEQAGEDIRTLRQRMASLEPVADEFASLRKADGTIVQAPAGEDFVYISLGRKDGLKPGLTFEVYSKYQPIPADGRGKASIKVSHVFENTAEGRITRRTPADPILRGDLVANPVFDRNRRYNFVVAGDFDLTFDGVVDDPDGRTIRQLIVESGGNVVDHVSPATDFVVLGQEPPAPEEIRPGVDEEAVTKRNQQRTKAIEVYNQVYSEATITSVPILTRTQFLSFLGLEVPKHVEPDKHPSPLFTNR